MKKILYVFATVLSVSLLMFITSNKAFADATIPNSYSVIKPANNANLQVNSNLQLEKVGSPLIIFEFFYVKSKDAYVINDQMGLQNVIWNGQTGSNNLIWGWQTLSDESLWLIEKLTDSKVIIHNKKNPNMVWTVNSLTPSIGDKISLANISNSTSQIFNLVSPR